MDEQASALNMKISGNQKMQKNKGFTLIELMMVVAIIGILAAIAVAQYQSFVSRSQATRVMGEAGALKTLIENCLLSHRITVGPNDCDPDATGSNLISGSSQGSIAIAADKGVPQITINGVANTATIVATFGNGAMSTLTTPGANQLTWSRTASGSWSCSSTIPASLRPNGC